MPPLAPGWELTQIDLETGAAKFDLYVELDARAKELLGRFMFNPDLFERSTVERLARSGGRCSRVSSTTPHARSGSCR